MSASTITTFDGAKAEKWKTEVAELNAEVEGVLTKVTAAIEEIKTTSAGSIAETFVRSAEEMGGKFQKLIGSIGKLLDVFVEVKQRYVDFENAVIEGVSGVVGKVLGG